MKLLVIDGNSILNRAFYGIRTLTNSKGLFTNGIYGFLNIYFKFMEEEKPDGACVAFDLKAPTFRHKEYSQYKAQRKGMPDELAAQVPILKEVLAALNSVAVFERAEVMLPEHGEEPECFGEFRSLLGGMALSPLGRYEFYDACCEPGVILAISTGESRTYGNLLLTIGVC